MTVDIHVDSEGVVRFIYDDALCDLMKLGDAIITRASHVEPEGTKWKADMGPSGGNVLGPFENRADALNAEKRWLLTALFMHGRPRVNRRCQCCGEPMGKAEWKLGCDRFCDRCWKWALSSLGGITRN